MSAIPMAVTEFFMMALCILSAPVEEQVIRVDVVGREGFIDTLIVQRSDEGFTVYDDMNGKLVKFAVVQPQEGSKGVSLCTDLKGRQEVVDLSDAVAGLNVSERRAESKVRLKTTDQVSIKVDRNGSVSFLKAEPMNHTYVVHSAAEMDSAKIFGRGAISHGSVGRHRFGRTHPNSQLLYHGAHAHRWCDHRHAGDVGRPLALEVVTMRP